MAGFDFSKIKVREESQKPIDPIEIFQSATVSDQNINDLWLAQGDALREWHRHRDVADVGIVLNTGAGKTLVGLLIAQSLVNATTRSVLYACSSIQLVEQTEEKARGYGLNVTTYHGGHFSNDAYQRGAAPCVTTYQALFNGKTIFKSHDIAAVIFDDAHTAKHVLRDQFSLNISRSTMPDTYMDIANLFNSYQRDIGRASSYEELLEGRSQRLFMIPPFELRRNVSEIRRIFLDAALDQNIETMFAWEHIRDHEELCCLMVSDSGVTLTPPTVPVSYLPYFNKDVKRVYLSATLGAPDAFTRAFGRVPKQMITPSTTAGECERMILVPASSNAEVTDVQETIDIIRDYKALILVPTYRRSEQWKRVASPPVQTQVTEAFNTFRNVNTPEKLIMVARFDGIDLPGDTCRVMVIDDLPTGTGPLERFQFEGLGMQASYRSTLASRIVQSFGRISRGMSDHGVVLLTGEKLVDWLKVPINRSLLPLFLQKQIKIGESVSDGADDLKVIASACLARSQSWIDFYAENMKADVNGSKLVDVAKMSDVALAEANYGAALWNRDFEVAVRSLNDSVLNKAFSVSQHTGAWLTLWLGYALELAGDRETARQQYAKAHGISSNIPPMVASSPILGTGAPVPQQVTNVARQMEVIRSSNISLPKSIKQDLLHLHGGGSAAQTEEAIRYLGQYLGLESTRPEKEFGTGPDVLWIGDDRTAICMEVKTDKKDNSRYRKDDVGQLSNHIQWVKDNTEAVDIVPLFVGPLTSASDTASPSPDMLVIELARFEALSKKLVSALEDASRDAIPLNLSAYLADVFKDRHFIWPGVFDSLDSVPLHDL